MNRLVALLRAINVGGRTVKMDRLRSVFEEMGLAGVETYIASGNVLFEPTAEPLDALERRIETHLARSLGFETATFLRAAGELAAAAAFDPFERLPPDAEASLYIGFLRAAPKTAAHEKLQRLANDRDAFALNGRELYWRSLKGMGQSPISGATLERMLGPMTMRNVRTARRLAALAGDG